MSLFCRSKSLWNAFRIIWTPAKKNGMANVVVDDSAWLLRRLLFPIWGAIPLLAAGAHSPRWASLWVHRRYVSHILGIQQPQTMDHLQLHVLNCPALDIRNLHCRRTSADAFPWMDCCCCCWFCNRRTIFLPQKDIFYDISNGCLTCWISDFRTSSHHCCNKFNDCVDVVPFELFPPFCSQSHPSAPRHIGIFVYAVRW